MTNPSPALFPLPQQTATGPSMPVLFDGPPVDLADLGACECLGRHAHPLGLHGV
jgi:hypothetical protein